MGVSTTRKSKATSSKGGDSKTKGIRVKKKTKIQAKKAAFREKLKVDHAIKSSKSKVQGTKKRKKKKQTALNTMGHLADTLGEFGQHNSLAMKVTTVRKAKQRNRIVQEEKTRMSQVYRHPVFQSDPLKAVLGHLEATLPPPP